MPIRAVIFDFGGVLVRTEDPAGRRKWEARLGLAEGELVKAVFDSDVSTRAALGEVPEDEVWKHVAATFRLNADEAHELEHDFWAGDRLDAELTQFLRDLRPRYKTAILSNAWSGARKAFVEWFGLGDVVDTMVISAEEGVAKPAPRIYQIAAERLGVRPEEVVFVDDMAVNARGAQAVGMVGVQFKSTSEVIAEVRRSLDELGKTGSLGTT
jgi:epoxide hydrolase-like predicted phosphatase